MAKKSPVVEVTSPWGGEIDPEGLAQGRDQFYVSGYSDKRTEYDQAVREKERPQPLKHRLQWVTVQQQNGTVTKQKESWYRARGYIPVLFDDCKTYGLDPAKSGFVKDADGTCRTGTQMLMICPAAKVAGHAKELSDRNEAMVDSYKSRAEEAAEAFNRSHPDYRQTAFEFDERSDEKPFDFESKLKNKF